MKKITIGAFLLFALAANVEAQDYKKVRTNLLLGKLEDAKTELEKVAADPKAANNAETYLLKSEVYGSIAGDEALRAKYANADAEAFEALKKYLELEPGGDKLKADNFQGVNGLSSSFSSAASKHLTAKNWDSAYAKFSQSAALSDLLIAKKWSTSAFDTLTYYYTAVSAQNAKKDDEAAQYYSKLADLKLKDTTYKHLYVFLTNHYMNKKDQANFNKYIGVSKEVFPDEPYWNELQFENTTATLSLPELVKKFEEDSAANKLSAPQYNSYGNLFLNDKRIKDVSKSEKAVYTSKALSAFTRAAEVDSSDALNTYNVGVTAYSIWTEVSDSARTIKGTTPAIKAKRVQADKAADVAADKSIEWLEKAYKQLEAKTAANRTETNSRKTSARLLSGLFEYKRERSKTLKPADYDKFDTKFKFYDTKY